MGRTCEKTWEEPKSTGSLTTMKPKLDVLRGELKEKVIIYKHGGKKQKK